jgi:ribosome hibernation promoting factor
MSMKATDYFETSGLSNGLAASTLFFQEAGMDLDIRIRHRATGDLNATREHLTGKLRNALRRLGSRLAWVVVHLDDVNGPRGGSDKRCVVRAQSFAGAHAVGVATGPDLFNALDQALRRALRGLRGAVGRTRRGCR